MVLTRPGGTRAFEPVSMEFRTGQSVSLPMSPLEEGLIARFFMSSTRAESDASSLATLVCPFAADAGSNASPVCQLLSCPSSVRAVLTEYKSGQRE